MYKLLSDKFINSSTKVKIELYLLPLMVLFLVYYWGFTNQNEIVKSNKSENIKSIFTEKKFDGDFLKFFTNIENIAKENQIFIKLTSEKNGFVNLSGMANKESFLQFLKEIEQLNDFTKIDSFILSQNINSFEYVFEIQVNLNHFFIKEKEEKVKENKVEIEINHTFILKGIVQNYALLNGNWIELNGIIDTYRLIKIDRDFVLLKSDNKEIKLELNHEEHFKRDN